MSLTEHAQLSHGERGNVEAYLPEHPPHPPLDRESGAREVAHQRVGLRARHSTNARGGTSSEEAEDEEEAEKEEEKEKPYLRSKHAGSP